MGSLGPHISVNSPFRARVTSGQVTPLMSFKFWTGNEAALMARMAGFEAAFIDMEHSALSIETVAQFVIACNMAGVSPVVRSPSKSHWHISRILDAGAAAVVIPHVDSVEEVRELVKHAKYGPLGTRGSANNQPILSYKSVPTSVQNEVLNRETMLIPMVETPAAVELAEEYLAIDGVDGILIGSNDLCTDLGMPGKYDDPIYQQSVEKVIAAGNKYGKPIGIGGIGGRLDLLEKWFAMGATWSLSAGDGAILQAGMKEVTRKYIEISARLEKQRPTA
ncbi:Pyruvate/Phosphoenolpyruvate kinase-like domain-containing protein [Aspergillus pseudoustus]|uniref:Pyruvate/Phosphoenolpyruvate kinase-like domain-containing protein n=1 Tax=Aspergillus pseudoustus TaxID=1810923 RepID=A0ABR4J644_9EURO